MIRKMIRMLTMIRRKKRKMETEKRAMMESQNRKKRVPKRKGMSRKMKLYIR